MIQETIGIIEFFWLNSSPLFNTYISKIASVMLPFSDLHEISFSLRLGNTPPNGSLADVEVIDLQYVIVK